MEYLEHGDLQRYLERPLAEAETRDIAFQVLEGLKHMHDNRFIHRDLKPGVGSPPAPKQSPRCSQLQNIMVVQRGPDWWVKIADFGISKRRHDLTTRQTARQGTLGFAAPEAIGVSSDGGDGPYSTAADLWSLGAVIFQALTNQSAFQNFAELAEYCFGTRKFPVNTLQTFTVSDLGQDFVTSLMLLKPKERPLADRALQHPWREATLSTTCISM